MTSSRGFSYAYKSSFSKVYSLMNVTLFLISLTIFLADAHNLQTSIPFVGDELPQIQTGRGFNNFRASETNDNDQYQW
jgi:hypothetical protein